MTAEAVDLNTPPVATSMEESTAASLTKPASTPVRRSYHAGHSSLQDIRSILPASNIHSANLDQSSSLARGASDSHHPATPPPVAAKVRSHKCFGFIGSPKTQATLIINGSCIALAALALQAKSNSLTATSNALAQIGNDIAEKSYKLQLWDDCRNRKVSALVHFSDLLITLTLKLVHDMIGLTQLYQQNFPTFDQYPAM